MARFSPRRAEPLLLHCRSCHFGSFCGTSASALASLTNLTCYVFHTFKSSCLSLLSVPPGPPIRSRHLSEVIAQTHSTPSARVYGLPAEKAKHLLKVVDCSDGRLQLCCPCNNNQENLMCNTSCDSFENMHMLSTCVEQWPTVANV